MFTTRANATCLLQHLFRAFSNTQYFVKCTRNQRVWEEIPSKPALGLRNLWKIQGKPMAITLSVLLSTENPP